VPAGRDFRRLTRGLRFRLTAGYALYFSVLLIGVAGLYRERLGHTLERQARDVLDQEWAATKGYLRIERHEPRWFYDSQDPDETFIVERLRRVYLLADSLGEPIESSTLYRSIGLDAPDTIQARIRDSLSSGQQGAAGKAFWDVRRNAQGAEFLIRAGVVFDEGHHAPYYVAIGRPTAESAALLRGFTGTYVKVLPGALLLGCLLGWVMAGRALKPVRAVAQTAQRISGSNLSLRIPARAAGDELDYLILTFNRMIERLENSFHQIRQFSTDVSHELRTPITAIRGQLEVALFTAQTAEQYREAILNALQDTERLSRIVRALLLLSQAESGQLVLQKTRMDLSEVVRDIVEQFGIPAEEAKVRLSSRLEPGCLADLDRVQVERLVSNLLSNAIKFTPAGGEVKVAVRPGAERPGTVEIVVEDTGRGIPEEHLPHIFDRFYRVTGSGAAPGPEQGLGLGLSFVAWISRAHDGAVHAESRPGEGSRFTVTLPAAERMNEL
jgi:heavy metal sensor kinase